MERHKTKNQQRKHNLKVIATTCFLACFYVGALGFIVILLITEKESKLHLVRDILASIYILTGMAVNTKILHDYQYVKKIKP